MSGITDHGQMRPGFRSPPHSREAEESVIGAVLLSEEAVNEVMDRLHPPDFYVPAHQAIFEAMRELFDTNQAIDAVTVSEALRRRGELDKVGGVAYLTRLVDIVPSTSNILYYSGIVEEHAKRRELIRAGASVTDVAFDIDEEIAHVLDRAEQAVLSVAERRSAQTLLEVGPLFSDVLEHIELLEQRGSELTGLATGYVDLDKKLAGLQAANLVVIAARPAMGKCLGGTTRVVDPMTGSVMAIRDLGAGQQAVLSLSEDLELGPATQMAWLAQGLQETYEVVTRLGRSIIATANHPFLTIRGWAELRELSVGREIAVPRNLEMNYSPQVLSDAQVALVGYLIGDGSLTSATPRFTNTNPDIVSDMTDWLSQLGLILSQDPDRPQYRIRRARIGSADPNGLTELLRELGLHGKTAHGKFVPDVIFRSPLRQIALFLNRLYACDGSARVDKDNYRVEFCTVSEQLASDVQHLLLRFGIVAKKRRREVKYKDGTRTAYDVSFQDPENVEKFIGHIGIHSKMERLADVHQAALNRKENAPAHDLLPMPVWDMVLEDKSDKSWADVSEATGRPRNHNWHVHERRLSKRLLLELGKALSSDRLLTLANSDIAWDPIVSIEPAGLRPTYDLSIDGFHNFVADDIIVHNSALALGIAVNAATQQEPVAIFSLEMSKEEIVQRILSSVGRVDSMKLRSGQLGPLWQRVVDAAGKMYQAPIYIDDSPVVTVTDIRAKCRRLKRKKGLSLVVIDYLQLMESSSRENRQQEISEITRNLKNLARELEVPVIAVSQLNRSLEAREDKRPRLSDLRESGCLTADTRLIRADDNSEVTLGELAASGVTNVPVWSLDDRYRLVSSNLTKAFSSGVKATFELELASGRIVRASGNHPFLTVEGWVRLDDLTRGEYLAVDGGFGVDTPRSADDEASIPASVWEYIRLKALPAANWSADDLAMFLEVPRSTLYESGISRARMRRLAEALDDDYLAGLADSDVLWDQVVAITPCGEEEVFDATVEMTHNFLANGIVAHNSIEQDADVVMFIYRHEYYHPEDQERKGIAEVIVAKHRAGSTGPVEVTFQPEFTRFANLGRDVT